MNIGMSTFYNPSLQGFLWMWLGIGAANVRFPSRSAVGSLTAKPAAPIVSAIG
jgi:hypothetical protein